ncbi:hypothetical protein AGABI1DRAFT_106729 [Agaricus bisporus var. burnettii JB137-S8]|uniref:Uncharacterized protein n=1 Tax=Agaricus bisporus var. burnettii (strain JB137-S8 / ATCC MYA-4627 / FGSC 10392) TaxID=597362 RepID=K5XVH2_AGABU|nr:uncharacterized protein AGABI1DRAFT_106729 [Agaricus bisporus var. burnettii JB137-S8]EKM79150.1 hypothetical protein AGABI1DRAFT_106729 [Agaricus bisporus var. burnettii JB137-S8]
MSAAECPRCGYHGATEFKEGIPALQAEVHRLEDLMARLQEEKLVLLHRINNAQEKTGRLPFEVLSNIFLFARPPIDFTAHEPTFYDDDDPNHPPVTGYYDPAEDFHHTLAAVSHRWRQVVLSTPQLWTSISLCVRNTFTEYRTSLLNLHFKNARDLGVSILLDFSNPTLVWENISSRRSDFLMHLEPLVETIFEDNSDQVRSLFLIQPPAEWSSFMCGSLPRCNSVTIYWPSSEPYCKYFFNFHDLPCLRHVKLVGSDFPLTLPATASVLQLSHTDLHKSIRLLVESPNLVEFESSHHFTGSLVSQSNGKITKPIILHRLENLTWDAQHIDDMHDFLRHVRFNNLRTLQWYEGTRNERRTSEEGESLRLAFFSSLPSTLSSLIFDEIDLDLPHILDLLSCIPQLTELHFINYRSWVVDDIIKAIGRSLADQGTPSSALTVLPNLCVLSISGAKYWGMLEPFVFIELLETLHAAGPRQKQFHLITYSEVIWCSDALDKVRALLSSGLDAKITFGVDGSKSEIS